jgi:hypothetical protein
MLAGLRRSLAGMLLVAGIASACGDGDSTMGGTSTVNGPSAVALNSPSCGATVGGLPTWVPGEGGRYALTVTAPAGCAWTATTDVTWASVAPASGSGSAAAMLTVSQNLAVGDGRSANVTIAGQTSHLSQANTCVYALDRTTADVGPQGENVRIAITTTAGCPWTNGATETWMRVVPASGSGSGEVRIETAPNMGGIRHAFATVAGLRVQITQQGR